MKNVNHEILGENFENLNKETDIQVQKAQKVPNKKNSKDLHQDIIKMAKCKNLKKIFVKATREKQR